MPPTQSQISKLASLRGDGASISDACKEIGLSTRTFYRWKEKAEGGEGGLYEAFYDQVVTHRKTGRLVERPTGDPDWRRIDYFQEWVAGGTGSHALILDSGDVWVPEPWQLAPIEDLLSDQFEAVWNVVPEANGKTTMTGGVVLYLLEHQLTPEIPIGSATVTQAETLFRQIEGFIVRSGRLSEFNLAPGVRRIDCRKTMGHTRVYPHNERSGDGVIPSAAVLDEGHLHPNLRLYRTWKGKYRKRRGPVFGISTAGEPSSEFEELRATILKRGEHTAHDGPPEYIRSVDKKTVLHDWAVRDRAQADDMEVVARANPLEVITAELMAEKRAEPEMTEAHWLRRSCNIPARESGSAIHPEQWDSLAEDPLIYDETAWCVAWVDFGWEIDTTAMGVLVWEQGGDRRVITGVEVFVPPDDGSVLEEDVVDAMVRIQNTYNPVGWVFDPATSGSMMAQQLDKGVHHRQGGTQFQMFRHPQDPKLMSLAAARFDEAIRTRKIVHDGDKVLRQHALNAVKKQTVGEKWRYDRPEDAKAGARRKKFPNDALIGVVMGHSYAVTEHENSKEPLAIWGRPR